MIRMEKDVVSTIQIIPLYILPHPILTYILNYSVIICNNLRKKMSSNRRLSPSMQNQFSRQVLLTFQ